MPLITLMHDAGREGQMPSRFILASGSPRRRELLASLGIQFDVITSDVDEQQFPDEDPFTYVQRLSRVKAQAVLVKLEAQAIVMGADTIVIHEGVILGKPQDAKDARYILRRLRGREHTVCTAFTLISSLDSGKLPESITRMAQTTVFMRDYTAAEIDAYIATGDPFDKAGSYAIQNTAFHPVDHIEGSYSNVMGLPVCAVRDALLEIGYALPDSHTARRCEEMPNEV